jgi:hypothetical protein
MNPLPPSHCHPIVHTIRIPTPTPKYEKKNSQFYTFFQTSQTDSIPTATHCKWYQNDRAAPLRRMNPLPPSHCHSMSHTMRLSTPSPKNQNKNTKIGLKFRPFFKRISQAQYCHCHVASGTRMTALPRCVECAHSHPATATLSTTPCAYQHHHPNMTNKNT